MQNRFARTSNDIIKRGEELRIIAYPDLANREVRFRVRRIKALGDACWSTIDRPVIITINKEIIGWPDPAVIGLLAHELSHPVVGHRTQTESYTDRDVIRRGLGAYLAFERAFVGRFFDEPLMRKRDYYMGYCSIRDLLAVHDFNALELMLRDFRLIPQRYEIRQKTYPVHDTIDHY